VSRPSGGEAGRRRLCYPEATAITLAFRDLMKKLGKKQTVAYLYSLHVQRIAIMIFSGSSVYRYRGLGKASLIRDHN
jgi:hypothetical protein